jgi:CIC family chloride channel protein
MQEGQPRAKALWASLRQFGRNDHVVMSVLAVLTGLAGGTGAVAFRTAIELFQRLSFAAAPDRIASAAAALPWWHVLLVPAAGGLLIGLMVHFFMPGRRPQAVANVIEASALHGGRMSLVTGLKAALISAASIGVGASVGREGPVVHLGASLGAFAAARLRLARAVSRTLLGCGVAAAVAASFNAPIAGVFFALEVVIGHYALAAFAPIVIASVTGTVVSRMYYGDFPAFVVPERMIASFWEFPAFALLGVVCALVAIIFMRSTFFVASMVGRSPIPLWSAPAFGGLATGAIAIVFPHVLGVGYEATDAALTERLPVILLFCLIVAKTAATAICLGSGFGGGVFSPSLFIGAMVGGAFGYIATHAMPELSSGTGAYTMVGMGAVAASVLGAPISTILMIFELTADYSLTVAVMVATAIATLVTHHWYGESFFTAQLRQRGVSVSGGQDVGLLRTLTVKQVMDDRYDTIAPGTPIATVRARLQQASWGKLFVVGDEARLHGTITFADLSDAAFDTSIDGALVADDVTRHAPATLSLDDDLETAFRVISACGEVHIPVVRDAQTRRLVGVVHEYEVMRAYHNALLHAHGQGRGEA